MKHNYQLIIEFFLALAILLFLSSCGGTRNTNVNKVDLKQDKKDSTVVEVKKEKQSETISFEAIPIIKTEPMIINGVVYRNATIRKVDTKIKEVVKEKKTVLTITKTVTLFKTKKTERTEYSLLLLIIGLLFLLFLVLKKYMLV